MKAQRSVIYLRGTDAGELEVAEKRCVEYARKFGWQVLGSIHDGSDGAGLGRLLQVIRPMRIEIVMTGSLEMISPDKALRDELMAVIERHRCFVHPVTETAARMTRQQECPTISALS